MRISILFLPTVAIFSLPTFAIFFFPAFAIFFLTKVAHVAKVFDLTDSLLAFREAYYFKVIICAILN